MNPTKRDGLEVRKIGREVLVLTRPEGTTCVLNQTDGQILELCDGTRSLEGIARDIAGATGADLTTVAPDIDAIIDNLAALGLLDR